MKNPFKFFRSSAEKHTPVPDDSQARSEQPQAAAPQPDEVQPTAPEPPEETDPFVEWRRTRTQGGIERRERNDIFEAYSVFGTDGERLICRYYHRYPEHEKDFDLSYERALSFTDFNKRLLSELDKGSLSLTDYHACIRSAEQLTAQEAPSTAPFEGFSDSEEAALRRFCDGMDILTGQEYLHADGILKCSCRSAVGDDALTLWFRKPLPHDALGYTIAGVTKKTVESYDIDNLWIMGVCNRLRESCTGYTIELLTSEWSLNKESVRLMTVQGFEGISDTLLIAVSDADAFARFGFYSLDFSRK